MGQMDKATERSGAAKKDMEKSFDKVFGEVSVVVTHPAGN
jgi:hypothetical protein